MVKVEIAMYPLKQNIKATALIITILTFSLISCSPFTDTSTSTGSSATSVANNCPSTCPVGGGVQVVQVFVEPDAGEHVITDAIGSAMQSVRVEMYLLSDTKVIHALEEAANRNIDVRVMLETHPYGGGSPQKTMDELSAAGIKVQAASPDFALTHEKGMIIDSKTVYIMTANFTRSALGGYSPGGYQNNREYGIIDSNLQDVQAVIAIFNADWSHTTAHFVDPDLVVSPINSRGAFTTLIQGARSTLLIETKRHN